MIAEAIHKLLEGHNLSADQSSEVTGEIMSGQATPVQIASYLTAMRMKGETVEEITGAARMMRDKATPIPHHQEMIFDNCGTGGDGAGTFNISTTASFVIAACGVPVGKHGNRSVSSRSGSADLLTALGANIGLSAKHSGMAIDEIGIGFLFAPTLHPAMKEVAPIRGELAFRSIFNLLGPLTNPARATHQLIGVFAEEYVEKIARAAGGLGPKKVMVVYNKSGLDELTTAGENVIYLYEDGQLSQVELETSKLGLPPCKVEDLAGGEAADNALITRDILSGASVSIGPMRDTVLLNAAAGLVLTGRADDIKQGLSIAGHAIDSGRATKTLNNFIQFTQSFDDA